MAGNTRGKLKEHFEGMHRNFDWVIYHVTESLELIKDHKPELSDGIKSLGIAVKALDDVAQDTYTLL